MCNQIGIHTTRDSALYCSILGISQWTCYIQTVQSRRVNVYSLCSTSMYLTSTIRGIKVSKVIVKDKEIQYIRVTNRE
jgi:hypothetical protein